MTIIADLLAEIRAKPPRVCKCGKPYELIRTMLSIPVNKSVRMFECKSCGERTWED